MPVDLIKNRMFKISHMILASLFCFLNYSFFVILESSIIPVKVKWVILSGSNAFSLLFFWTHRLSALLLPRCRRELINNRQHRKMITQSNWPLTRVIIICQEPKVPWSHQSPRYFLLQEQLTWPNLDIPLSRATSMWGRATPDLWLSCAQSSIGRPHLIPQVVVALRDSHNSEY
jgi:hypothetical protein